ncbi:MAG: CRISPR-associated helicase Cas3' [Eubacteriales bacterium]|nr:CRISPR-associated helicase Cas3' [Eubacteriales bacterium]
MESGTLLARRTDERRQTLKAHSEGVAEYAARTGETFGLPALARLCGLLHDMGKASDAFQAYLEKGDPSQRGTVVHSAQGAVYALRRWGGGDALSAATAEVIAVAIASHHGRLPDLVNEDGDSYLEGKRANGQFTEPDALAELFFTQVVSEAELDRLFAQARGELGAFRTRLLQVCGDLQDVASRKIAIFNLLGLLQRGLFGALIDADRWDAYRFEAALPRETPATPPWEQWSQKLENKLAGFARVRGIDRLRAQIADDCLASAPHGAGVYRLSVPTGGGKTFSSLRFALAAARQAGMERIVYAAPYKTILEQTARVFRETLGNESLILEHHSDVSFGDEEEKELKRYQLLSQRWNAPMVLTTTVQLLDTLFAGRNASVRRFPALSRCVVILDEVQCVPVRCWYLLTLAIRYLSEFAGCAVVLCTATQPLWESLPAFALPEPIRMVPNEAALYHAFKRVEVTDRTGEGEFTPEALAAEVARALPGTGSALCVMNTKKCALNLFAAMKAVLPEATRLYCLTTLQCPAHRLQLLDEIRALLAAGEPVVCVSTQLIEAGVDVSFGLMVRAMAGLESLAQAAGRCNRNGERERGTVWLVRVAGEALGALPDIRRAQSQTQSVLDDYNQDRAKYRNDLLSPEALERYFRTFIRENAAEMRYPDPERKDGCNLLDLLSVNERGLKAYQDHHPGRFYSGAMAQAFKQAGNTFRALDEPTTAVAAPWGEGKALIEELAAANDLQTIYKLLRRLQPYTVSLYKSDLEKLAENHALRELEQAGLFAVDGEYYDETLGLTTGRQEMEALFS